MKAPLGVPAMLFFHPVGGVGGAARHKKIMIQPTCDVSLIN